MKQTRLLFIDRDGTLIQEPEDEQIDSFKKLVFTKGVFRNLSFIAQHTDYELVMVSNQDGLGTDSFPEDTFWPVHNFIIQTLESEGIHFAKQHIDRPLGAGVTVGMNPFNLSNTWLCCTVASLSYVLLRLRASHCPFSTAPYQKCQRLEGKAGRNR